jgi:hypothetical protein
MFTVHVNANVYVQSQESQQILAKLAELMAIVSTSVEQGVHMAGELQRLTQEVAETKTVMQSAAVLLGTLAQRIRDLATDPAALNQLADELDQEQSALGAAIVANTPADEPPTP